MSNNSFLFFSPLPLLDYPRVYVSPSPLSIEKGGTAQITCQVDAKPAVNNVRWMRGGRFIATTFNHTLRSVSLDDDGTYVCSADNGLGKSGEAELQVDVLYPPAVTVESKREIELGSTLVIPCNVSSKPAASSIEWFKEGDAQFRSTGEFLRLNRAVATDAAKYTCQAVNVIGGMERSGNGTFQLMVRHEPGPAKITPEEPIAVDEGSITLTCSADPPGWPTPQYRWWREGAEGTSLSLSQEFTIPVAKANSEGKYFCQPQNHLGVGSASSAQLKVYQPPRFQVQLPSTMQKREADEDFNITCSAQGKPKPSIVWLKDGEEIQPTNNNYEFITEESEGKFSVFTVRSILRFYGVGRQSLSQITADDRGTYTCAFTNEARRIESSMMLKVERKCYSSTPLYLPQPHARWCACTRES